MLKQMGVGRCVCVCVLKELVCAVKGEDEGVEGFGVKLKIICSTQNGQPVPWP